jgi:hypothetical protein
MPNDAELLVWTDIDPAHEEEFNRWYDREHMAERVGISGFRWGRRYRAAAGGRRYLALYRTEGLEVFRSAEYRQAFARQTAWSIENLARMQDPVRRVAEVALMAGEGTGGALALLPLGDTVPLAGVASSLAGLHALDGALGGYLLVPDAALSTPLPAERAEGRVLERLLLLQATGEAAAERAMRRVAEALGAPAERGRTFSLMWELAAPAR